MNYDTTHIEIAGIKIPTTARALSEETVLGLMESIRALGLQTPITIRLGQDDDGIEQDVLVVGRHRLEACKRLGMATIPAYISTGSPNDIRLLEITENLHRSELTVLERSEQVAEWIDRLRMSIDKADEVRQVPKGGRGKVGGISDAAKVLGMPRTNVSQYVRIANITPEAKQAARDASLENNQSALLEIARAPIEDQIKRVGEIQQERAAPKQSVAVTPEPDCLMTTEEWKEALKAQYNDMVAQQHAPLTDEGRAGYDALVAAWKAISVTVRKDQTIWNGLDENARAQFAQVNRTWLETLLEADSLNIAFHPFKEFAAKVLAYAPEAPEEALLRRVKAAIAAGHTSFFDAEGNPLFHT